MDNKSEGSNIPITNINEVNNSLKFISNGLEKACKAGQFTLQEAYLMRVAFLTLEKSVKNFEVMQNVLLDIDKKNKSKLPINNNPTVPINEVKKE
jgi:hypothetical protein